MTGFDKTLFQIYTIIFKPLFSIQCPIWDNTALCEWKPYRRSERLFNLVVVFLINSVVTNGTLSFALKTSVCAKPYRGTPYYDIYLSGTQQPIPVGVKRG